ncbi:MAG: YigZ family protein [Firmicutes bacterium]|nr:YigZ family protein [Bacillota bacterium]
MTNEARPEMYTTVAQAVRVRVPIGLCRFFASVKEVQSEAEAKEFIEAVSNEFADATHNAWAYKVGHGDSSIRRYSDAGEPANTAGPPMLQAIEGRGLTNVVVVGTRYFGGVKLGVGGLIRAYRDTALAGLEAAGVRQEIIMIPVTISAVDYAYLGDVLREIESFRGSIATLDYGEQVTVKASVRPADVAELQQRITDITRGQAQMEVANEQGS